MPRTARKKSKTGVYHVTLRGINRQQIFIDAEDAERFLQAVAQGDGSSVLTNPNIKQGDCVKRTVPVTPGRFNRNRPKVQSAVIHSGDGSCCANTEFDTTKREHRRTVPLCFVSTRTARSRRSCANKRIFGAERRSFSFF